MTAKFRLSERRPHPGLAAVKSLEGRTVERVGLIATNGGGEDLILSLCIHCTDGHRVHVVSEFWTEGDLPWLEISEGTRR